MTEKCKKYYIVNIYVLKCKKYYIRRKTCKNVLGEWLTNGYIKVIFYIIAYYVVR